jgi:hypothetical protein
MLVKGTVGAPTAEYSTVVENDPTTILNTARTILPINNNNNNNNINNINNNNNHDTVADVCMNERTGERAGRPRSP